MTELEALTNYFRNRNQNRLLKRIEAAEELKRELESPSEAQN